MNVIKEDGMKTIRKTARFECLWLLLGAFCSSDRHWRLYG
jgi:hypothetical protein